MKKITLKGFSGLTYITITHVPVKKTDFGEVINMAPKELEVLVSFALIENKIPIHGAEFRVMKSAMGLSNQSIANQLGISRNTVLKWGKNLEKRIPIPYEMLFRLLVAESIGANLEASVANLRAADKTKSIHIKCKMAT